MRCVQPLPTPPSGANTRARGRQQPQQPPGGKVAHSGRPLRKFHFPRILSHLLDASRPSFTPQCTGERFHECNPPGATSPIRVLFALRMPSCTCDEAYAFCPGCIGWSCTCRLIFPCTCPLVKRHPPMTPPGQQVSPLAGLLLWTPTGGAMKNLSVSE